MTLHPGQILNNRYRVVKLLGQGGFGAVYRAWDMNVNRACAVKENLDGSPEAQQQFGREAMILANLDHPNLPRVNDYFFIPGQGQYLVMDFVDGDDLQQMLDRAGGPVSEALALAWMAQVCAAVMYLHAQAPPIIHRDIKPANIKITPDGKVKLVDFGIAKIYDPNLRTTFAARAVTPGYSPPEQYGQANTDGRSDVYALGATLYTIITGRPPTESVQRSIGAVFDPPRQTNPGVSPQTEAVILKAMEMTPTARYQSAYELNLALSGRQASPVFSPGPRPPQTAGVTAAPAEKPATPRNWIAWGGGAVAGAAVLGVALFAIAVIFLFSRAGGIFPPSTNTPMAAAGASTRTPRPALTEEPASGVFPTATGPGQISPSRTLPVPAGPGFTPTPTGPPAQSAAQTATPTAAPTDTPTLPPTPAPTATPANRLIAYYSNQFGSNDIYVMDLDGSNPRQLTTSSSDERIPAWSPDGKEIAYQSNEGGDFEIFVYTVSSGRARQVTNNNCDDYAPTWSGDGRQFVFYSTCDGNREIFAINTDGSSRRQLTYTDEVTNWFPMWSPDGRLISFSSNRSGEYRVYTMSPDGSNATSLAKGCVSAFSPDSRMLVFDQYCSDPGDLSVIQVDGSGFRVVFDQFPAENPSWVSTSQIIFEAGDRTNAEIYMVNLDGSGFIQITNNGVEDSTPVVQP